MRLRTLDPDASPEAAFGVQLRRSREAAGYTQIKLAELVPCHPTYISKIETATEAPTLELARRFDELLQTGGTLELMWRQMNHAALIEGFPDYVKLEERADLIRFYDVWVVPGLLQTDEYITALMMSFVRRGAATEQQAEERLTFRRARKQSLARDPAPVVHAVLSESCLRRVVGDYGVMERQFEHLEQLAQRPGITLQVLPFDRSDLSPFDMPITLLGIGDRTSIGYTETLERGFVQRDRDKVRAWQRDYDRLMAEALSPAESLNVISQARKERSA
jgi:transcriptional regulator with XRE-family HTH domain